jgi:hypothetical protein
MGLTIYGASDDLIEVEGDFREEYYLTEDDASHLRITHADHPEIGLIVKAFYSRFGWIFGVSGLWQEGEEGEILKDIPWGVKIQTGDPNDVGVSTYSTRVEIDCPPEIVVEYIDPSRDEDDDY